MKTSVPDDAEILAVLRDSAHRPRHVSEIAEKLAVPIGARRALSDQLEALVERGLIARLPGSRYRIARERGARIEGRFSQNPRGFGFVTADDGGADVYVPGTAILGAMHGDLVAVAARSGARGREGIVLEVLARRPPRVPGVLRVGPRGTWVEPDDARLRGPIPVAEWGRGRDGEAVVCEIIRWPEHPAEVPLGLVRETLGAPGDLDVEVLKVLLREGVEESFAEPVMREADQLPDALGERDYVGREDLRGLELLTIDPDDARDHDDAVLVERRADGGYVATVAIADVSHYVRAGSALDAAALERGTSIYLPDRAIPMLPHQLSSHLASLVEGQDRLALGVQVELSADGAVESSRLFEAVIRSRARLTYGHVARALGWTDQGSTSERAEALRERLEVAAELSARLRQRRLRRGALDFDLPEARVRFGDDARTPVDIVQSRMDPGILRAYQLIEELMLLANEVVARVCVQAEAPAVFRVHGQPDEEALAKFAAVARAYGHRLDIEAGRAPKKLTEFLRGVRGRPEARVLGMLLLRAMQQARYAARNLGHFGLASEAYLHFTSPIRRYPDLVVHRAVRALVRGERAARDEAAQHALTRAAAEASRLERRAMEVEREVMDLYRCAVARKRIGEIHGGMVAGVSTAGPFVDLEQPYVSGLLRMDGRGPDGWEIDELGIALTNVRTGRRFALGDALTVVITDVSLPRRTVYVTLPPEDREAERPRRARKTGTLPGKKAGRRAKGRG